jgi:hypothetical protein
MLSHSHILPLVLLVFTLCLKPPDSAATDNVEADKRLQKRVFEANPEAWQSLRYLNLGPATENKSFKSYLSGWHQRVPAKHKAFVKKLAAEFGIELT